MRALLVDDHVLTREGLVALLRAQFPHWSFVQVNTIEEGKPYLAPDRDGEDVALLVINLRMPGTDWWTNIRTLRESCRTLRIAILSSVTDRQTILDSLAAGAHGYVLKTDPPSRLMKALEVIVSGGIYVPPQLSELAHLESVTPDLLDEPPRDLSARQGQVLKLLASGRSTKDIARSLNLGVGTVKVHLSCVYRTLGVRNRTEAAAMFHDRIFPRSQSDGR